MNKDTLKGQWKQLKGEVKNRWGKVTDDQITQVEGDYDKLVGVIQEKYGYEKEKAEGELNDWLAEHPDTARVLEKAGKY
jgi:uncharacterized protein YjbJ (UPF0337 family)